MSRRAAPGANPIPWLAWHLLRVQDDHVAGVADREQVWTAEGWADRFGLPFDASETGYGFDDDLDRVVDPSYDPPVTLGVRLVSVLSDDLQHLGQAAYVHGLVPGS